MARDWKPRQPPAKTSLTEIARRYHAAAVALAQTLGLSVPEVLAQHRESVTAIFIESGRCDLRLPAGVQLPPLVTTAVEPSPGRHGGAPVEDHTTVVVSPNGQPPGATVQPLAPETSQAVAPTNGARAPDLPPEEAPPPTTIPAGLPCAGQAIADLKPAQLRMLLSLADQRAAAEGRRWQPLLEALAAERAARLQAGQRRKAAVPEDGHGA
jgi:hypothetical protein